MTVMFNKIQRSCLVGFRHRYIPQNSIYSPVTVRANRTRMLSRCRVRVQFFQHNAEAQLCPMADMEREHAYESMGVHTCTRVERRTCNVGIQPDRRTHLHTRIREKRNTRECEERKRGKKRERERERNGQGDMPPTLLNNMARKIKQSQVHAYVCKSVCMYVCMCVSATA